MSIFSLHKRRNASTLRCFGKLNNHSSGSKAQQADLQLIELAEMRRFILLFSNAKKISCNTFHFNVSNCFLVKRKLPQIIQKINVN